METIARYDLIIGNPPFSLAEEFVRKSLSLLTPFGEIVFLLRMSFMEGHDRAGRLFKEFPPYMVHVAGRVPYTHVNRTDDTAYAVFHWANSYAGSTSLSWELIREWGNAKKRLAQERKAAAKLARLNSHTP